MSRPAALVGTTAVAPEATAAPAIWIDLDNSPHVPFFRPIVQALRERGLPVLLTARDAYQVTALLQFHRLDCRVVGRHFGRHKALKAAGLLLRAAQLLPLAARARPMLAVSHGSRAQMLAARLLGIRSVVMADYEHVTHLNRCDVTIVPEMIPAAVAARRADEVLTYPGLKEDVYAAGFVPDPTIVAALGLGDAPLIVTVRPPATEAHYHNPESEALLDAVVARIAACPGARIVMLPRQPRQAAECAARWPQLMANRTMVVPPQAVDGLNLVWHSDLVVSGGGTMNREAAALGVPVYSIFRGRIGAVDRCLAEQGRLVLLESVEQVGSRLALEPRPGAARSAPPPRGPAALGAIVAHLARLAEGA